MFYHNFVPLSQFLFYPNKKRLMTQCHICQISLAPINIIFPVTFNNEYIVKAPNIHIFI